MKSFDAEATLLTKKNMEPVRYTNLDGGKYFYRLSVVNTSTNEIQQTTTIQIVKEKAFYEQIWFCIIAVADTFDAMYSTRPYRKKLPLDYVASEIQKGAGTQFDPAVVEKFIELVKEGAFDGE